MKTARYCGALIAVALLAAACGDDDKKSGGEALTEIGTGEKALNLIIWAGYAEDGSTYPEYDWVHPFQEQTGCVVKSKIAATSDEMFQLMGTNEYDGVSASGDSSVRLIDAGLVAPVNTALIKNYADLSSFLKDTNYNSSDGKNYGIPHGWGANYLMWNTDVVTPAPDSWSVVFDKASPYSGKVTAYDAPIYIADAALYLKTAQPDLGIEDPYSLNQAAVRRRGCLAQGSALDHRRVLEQLHQDPECVRAGLDGARHHMAGHQEPRRGERCAPSRR